MILYVKCSCKTKDKLLIKKYKDLGFEIRDLSKDSSLRKEIKEYPSLRLPFTVINGTASQL